MMRRALALLFGLFTAATIAVAAPAGAVGDAPIGPLGDTLRIQTDNGIVADVTVHDVQPVPVPPGWTWTGHPGYREAGGPWRAGVTVHVIESPQAYSPSVRLTFRGVTPFADAYVSKHTDAPDSLETLLANAPAGSTVNGGVYWHVYRDLVTNVVLLDAINGEHLAQWNL
ncbi:hypothetical protein [Mycolicibacillus trivialis]|nr:hypothetical protein [Mycolicibacillus trivialis]